MSEGSGTRFRLPVWRILCDTFLIPAQHTREFCKPLAVPGLVLAVFTLGWQLTRSGLPAAVGWALYSVYVAAFTVLAVSCHRLVLLGPSPAPLIPKLRWGLRETKFLGWIVVLAVIFVVGRLLLMLVIANVLLLTFFQGTAINAEGPPNVGAGWLKAADYIAIVISAYVVARFSVVLPATAIDDKVNLRWAWQESARNGWRLAVLVGAFPWVLFRGVDLMYRENATLPELAILVVLSVLASMLGIIALSLSYQDLRSVQE
jgi:hypothetical protein